MKIKDLYVNLIKDKNVVEFDVRYLISFFQNFKKISLFYFHLEDEVKNFIKIKNAFIKLKKGIPLAYIINETFFLGHKYYVNENTLIPRVETEELVFLVFKNIKKYLSGYPLNVLDVGTGSGIIAIEVKKKYKNRAQVFVSEISKKALSVAKKNAKKHNVEIFFQCADTWPCNKEKYNVVISNPPYIRFKKNVDKNVLENEPSQALFFSEKNNVYKKIFEKIEKKIIFPCLLIFEISSDVLKKLNNLIIKYLNKYDYFYTYGKDINQKIRFLSVILKGNKK